MSDALAADRSIPSKRNSPLVLSSSRRISRPTVVLPQPDSPTRPSVSPGKMSNETSCTARTVPLAPRRPPRTSKFLVRLRTVSSGSPVLASVTVEPAPAARPDELAVRDLGNAVTARQPAGVGADQFGLGLADRDSVRAARRKAAAGRRRRGIGRQAFDGLELVAARPVEPRNRAQQAHRIGMARTVEHVVGVALFDQPRGIHHDDAVGVARHHAEIMRDHDQRDIQLARQVLHQFEDLRLDGDVERGGRLVGDDQLGIAGEPDRDHDALAHAAGELMRILLEPARRIGNADQAEQFDGARARLVRVHAEMDGERLGDLQSDGQDRIERGHRLLEDHRDFAASELAHLLFRERQQIAAVEHHAAFGDAAGQSRQQPHDRQRRYRLAGAGFADDRDHLAGVDVKRQSLHRADHAARGQELDMEVLDLEQG